MIAASRCASLVDAAMCGVNTTLSNVVKGLSSKGSFSNTSNPALRSGLSFNASYKSSSLMIPPLAQFKIIALSFIFASCSFEIKPFVSGVKGT